MSIKEIIEKYRKQLLLLYPIEEAESIINLVMEEILGYDQTKLFLNLDKAIDQGKLMRLESVLRDLKRNKPVQYVLEVGHFFDLDLFVNEHVLIPRQETEELVKWIIDDCKGQQNLKILDVGTGSGCIAVALKKNLPDAEITAIDVSNEAIDVAKENAEQHKVEINIKQVDILNTKDWDSFDKFDLIVSNPPYVTESERSKLHKNVIAYEPHTALFVSDNDPLIFYKAIIEFSKSYLAPEGRVYFEINEKHAQEIKELCSMNGFGEVEVKQDMNGKDRMVKAIQ